MSDNKENKSSRYDTFRGALVGILPTLIYGLVSPATSVSLGFVMVGASLMVMFVWYLVIKHANRKEELSQEIERLERELNLAKEEISLSRDISLEVVYVDWDKGILKFSCNVDTNILRENHCVTIELIENECKFVLGVARITNYDIRKKIAQADICNADAVSKRPTKENIYITPTLAYEVVDEFLRTNKPKNREREG